MWLFLGGLLFLITCTEILFLPLSLFFPLLCLYGEINMFVLSPPQSVCWWYSLKRCNRGRRLQAMAGSLHGPSIVPFPVISSPDPPTAPEEDKVRMCRDRHKEKAKTKRGWAGRGKNNTGRGQVPSTVCYLASLASCVEPYRRTHPVKLLAADNKASGHTAKFFICVYPHGKAD